MDKDTCHYYYYDYDRNCCEHKDSLSGRCGYDKCPLKIEIIGDNMNIDTVFNIGDSVALRKVPETEYIVSNIKIDIDHNPDLGDYAEIKIEIGKNNYNAWYHPSELIKYDPNWQYEFVKKEIESWPQWKQDIGKQIFNYN